MIATLRRWLDNPRALVLLLAGALVIAALSLYVAVRERRHEIRLAAGDPRGRRAEIARALADEASRHFASPPSATKSSHQMTSALMKPRSKSV